MCQGLDGCCCHTHQELMRLWRRCKAQPDPVLHCQVRRHQPLAQAGVAGCGRQAQHDWPQAQQRCPLQPVRRRKRPPSASQQAASSALCPTVPALRVACTCGGDTECGSGGGFCSPRPAELPGHCRPAGEAHQGHSEVSPVLARKRRHPEVTRQVIQHAPVPQSTADCCWS